MNTIYMPDDAYQALVADLARVLSPYHADPADRLQSVHVVLDKHGLGRPELAATLDNAERWPVTEDFDPDQVKMILGEEGDIWPETIREDAEPAPPITLPADTLDLIRQTREENEEGQAITRPHLDPAYVAQVDAMSLDELVDRLTDR